jgi:hypothetical protein
LEKIMKTTVYHVVTERPMAVGQKIVFDGNHPNGVCLRVRAWEKISRGEAVDGEVGALIASNPGRWRQVALRELAMEKIRLERFPHLPSRLACLYTSRTLEEARSWAGFFRKLGRKVFSVVRLEVNGNVFDGDACNCFDGVGDETDLENALRYWQNAPTEHPVIETLADGEITVCEIIENYLE